MGHQLNFYALPADMAALERKLLETDDVAILHGRSETAEPRIVASIDLQEHGRQWLFFYLVRRAEMSEVITRHVPKQGYWAIDDTRSPVIELTRCFFDNSVVRRGRLWYADGFYGDDRAWVEKSGAFRAWAAQIRRQAKKVFSKWKTDYVGAEAKQFLDAGGRFDP